MKAIYLRRSLLYFVYSFSLLSMHAQNLLPLTNLSFFQDPGPSWSIVGNVNSGLADKAVLSVFPGTGILANLSDISYRGQDIITKQPFGGMDIELDYMMAPGSNSGIYMQGRYEVQLRDSWGIVQPTAADNGGIYERWNESLPEGLKGYDGHAPRQNASRAPGTWQHIKISFQAPRFNAAGQKKANASILRVELNGVLIQENIELSGPTRGAMSNDEVPLGPLRLQGDHGSVAFRNIKITAFDSPLPDLINLKYALYKGMYNDETGIKKMQPDVTGNAELISMNVTPLPPVFLIHFSGVLRIKEPGAYHFGLNISGGRGSLKINSQDVISLGQGKGWGSGNIILPVGEFPLDIIYSKLVTWDKPVIGMEVAGPGIRIFRISDANVGADHENPIVVNASVNTILRSFSDVNTFKVTHAVNVGSPLQVHYTYDLDKGMIVQVWRGDFLDVSSMWHGRGDGTARPLGMVLQFGIPVPALEKLGSPETKWSSDTSGSGFRTKGYILDEADRPGFRYLIYKTQVNDKIRILPNGQGIHREISLENPIDNVYLRLAAASTIEMLSDGLYLLDDKSYYIRIDDASKAKPVVREVSGYQELIIPFKQAFSYSILF
jgi:hypothetical protein